MSIIQTIIEKICPRCGKSFKVTKRLKYKKYCSKKCVADPHYNIPKKCPVCGILFIAKTYEPKTYCSRSCYYNDPKVTSRLTTQLKKHTTKKPTKPQIKLLLIIKHLYPNNTLESETKVTNYSIDVAIPELMLGFEYDEQYWHNRQKEYDNIRHSEIEFMGWKLLHIKSQIELRKMVPIELWEKINYKINKTHFLERIKIMGLCESNISVEDILNTPIILNEDDQKNLSNTEIKKCPCGKYFEVLKSRHRKFCSIDCAYIFRHKPPKNKDKKIIKICPVCGKSFEDYKNNKRYLCSSKCAHKIGKGRTKNDNLILKRNCIICGKYFETYKSEGKKFCSTECYYEYKRKILKHK